MLQYMLDTNICTFTIKHKPRHVRETFNQHSNQLCIGTVPLMELVYGAEKSASPEHNLSVIEGFAARLEVLDYDASAAYHSGELRSELVKAGTPIDPCD